MIFGTYKIPKNMVAESVLTAIKNGFRHIDTAELYNNQKQVGEGIKHAIDQNIIKRSDIIVTTKISRRSLLKNNVQKSVNESLKKLDIQYIDFVLLHCPIDCKLNWKLLTNFYKKNKDKIKNIGVSNFNIQQLKDILSYYRPEVNQIEINPKFIRKDLISFCKKNNIHITAHSITSKKSILKLMPFADVVSAIYATGAEPIVTTVDSRKMKENILLSLKIHPQTFNDIYDDRFVNYPQFI